MIFCQHYQYQIKLEQLTPLIINPTSGLQVKQLLIDLALLKQDANSKNLFSDAINCLLAVDSASLPDLVKAIATTKELWLARQTHYQKPLLLMWQNLAKTEHKKPWLLLLARLATHKTQLGKLFIHLICELSQQKLSTDTNVITEISDWLVEMRTTTVRVIPKVSLIELLSTSLQVADETEINFTKFQQRFYLQLNQNSSLLTLVKAKRKRFIQDIQAKLTKLKSNKYAHLERALLVLARYQQKNSA